jgi:hypothetical protein
MAHDQEVVGWNPGTVYWMDVRGILKQPQGQKNCPWLMGWPIPDVSDASYNIHQNKEHKDSRMGHTKKI